ncbi:hypothetical protein VNO78_00634 [Psophocarpus tetragonolobus]|uniref:Uncharacterized protein n=1 Tax=Psophocarpus tetragonolobus TaxID=3891 RepID=A0AAN9T9J5_PSOTE
MSKSETQQEADCMKSKRLKQTNTNKNRSSQRDSFGKTLAHELDYGASLSEFENLVKKISGLRTYIAALKTLKGLDDRK